jgi:hypothetical protein
LGAWQEATKEEAMSADGPFERDGAGFSGGVVWSDEYVEQLQAVAEIAKRIAEKGRAAGELGELRIALKELAWFEEGEEGR